MDRIRNFSIIAHIDHGKSTLADRLLELTGTVGAEHRPQLLDSMELERERGITIKAQAVRVSYRAGDGETYHLHLIDTPGHVDFSYEVSRSLAACEGALLVVDAAQGVEAQTVANTYAAVEAGLELIPVLNKVDLPSAEPERVAAEITDLVGGDPDEVLRISAKTGEGVEEVLEAIVARIPPPRGDAGGPAAGADLRLRVRLRIAAWSRTSGSWTAPSARASGSRRMQTGTEAEIDEIGFFVPQMRPGAGNGRGRGRLRDHRDQGRRPAPGRRHADPWEEPAAEPLPGYREVKPMVFCGLFPLDTDRYEDLRDALDRLALNDAALSYEPETSQALGFGFRCGFLGLLHMDIVRERLEREYGLELLATTPNVRYEVELRGGERASRCEARPRCPIRPRSSRSSSRTSEPRVIAPAGYVGAVMELCQGRRGTHVDMHYLSPERVQLRYDLPLAEIVLDFYDQLKSRTAGYASLDYEPIGNRASDLVKLDVLLAGERVDALSVIVHSDDAYRAGKALVERLQRTIPAAALRCARAGRDRLPGARPRDGQGAAQGRHREALRRRRDPQAQAAREAEGGQEADEAGGPGRGAAGGVPVGAGGGRRPMSAGAEERIALARRGIELYDAGDLEGTLEMLSPDVETYAPPELMNRGTFHGIDAFLRWAAEWNEAWESFDLEVLRVEAVGERHAVAVVHQRGRGRGSGLETEADSAFVFELGEDGLCVYFALYNDIEDAFTATRRARGARRSRGPSRGGEQATGAGGARAAEHRRLQPAATSRRCSSSSTRRSRSTRRPSCRTQGPTAATRASCSGSASGTRRGRSSGSRSSASTSWVSITEWSPCASSGAGRGAESRSRCGSPSSTRFTAARQRGSTTTPIAKRPSRRPSASASRDGRRVGYGSGRSGRLGRGRGAADPILPTAITRAPALVARRRPRQLVGCPLA